VKVQRILRRIRHEGHRLLDHSPQDLILIKNRSCARKNNVQPAPIKTTFNQPFKTQIINLSHGRDQMSSPPACGVGSTSPSGEEAPGLVCTVVCFVLRVWVYSSLFHVPGKASRARGGVPRQGSWLRSRVSRCAGSCPALPIRLHGETTGYESLERRQVTSPWKDDRLRVLGYTTGYEPLDVCTERRDSDGD